MQIHFLQAGKAAGSRFSPEVQVKPNTAAVPGSAPDLPPLSSPLSSPPAGRAVHLLGSHLSACLPGRDDWIPLSPTAALMDGFNGPSLFDVSTALSFLSQILSPPPACLFTLSALTSQCHFPHPLCCSFLVCTSSVAMKYVYVEEEVARRWLPTRQPMMFEASFVSDI